MSTVVCQVAGFAVVVANRRWAWGTEVATSKKSRRGTSSREASPFEVRWPTTSPVLMWWSDQSLLLMAGS